MIRRLILRSAPALLLAFCLAAPARAQDVKDTATDPKADESAPDAPFKVDPVPGDWSIKPEVQKLDTQVKTFSSLLGSLNRANKDLGDEFKRYQKDPTNQLVASSLEKKLAAYAAQVSGDFDKVIADQDALTSNFRMLKRKLGQLSGHLGSKAGDFEERLKGFKTQARDLEKQLIDMSVKLKEDPPTDPDQKKQMERDFAKKLRAFQMRSRYANGYASRYQNYLMLKKNLEKLADLFVNLQEKFGDLIDNLQNEKTYLHDSIELQLDMLKIKQILRDGVFGGDKAIKNVSEKLADLYVKVDAFTTIHDRINQDLNKFIDTNVDLMKIGNDLDNIGKGSWGDASKSLQDTIDEFYKKKDAPPAADDDIFKGKEGSADAPPK